MPTPPFDLHPKWETEEEYYKPAKDLVGQEIDYYGMKCRVDRIVDWVKPEHFETLAAFRCRYILQVINPSKEILEMYEEGYLWADSAGIMHSWEIEEEEARKEQEAEWQAQMAYEHEMAGRAAEAEAEARAEYEAYCEAEAYAYAQHGPEEEH